MLHILDGESSAETLKRSGVPGEKFAWAEVMVEGPTPAGVEGDDWLNLRARFLSNHFDLDFDECERRLKEQEDVLQSLASHDEVVLWFEHDLFCQANLIYLLDWCAHNQSATRTKLSLISIDRFPGIEDFRGLGQLNPQQLASLFNSRHVVNEAELVTASATWSAYRAPQPTALLALLQTDLSALPFLKRALALHLARFPSVRNGLSLIENTLLQLIAAGHERFVDLFLGFGKQQPVFGFGDSQLWLLLRRLSQVPVPLVNVHAASQEQLPESAVRESRFELTDAGQDVVNNRADHIQLNGIDQWLGGVHLQGRAQIWRWDAASSSLRRL